MTVVYMRLEKAQDWISVTDVPDSESMRVGFSFVAVVASDMLLLVSVMIVVVSVNKCAHF
jgi:hypothetical protein